MNLPEAKVSRRRIMEAGLLVPLAAITEACGLGQTSAPPTPTTEPRYSLLEGQRAEILKDTKALTSVVQQTINPRFYEVEYLQNIVEASDTELVKFWRSGVKRIEDGVKWKIQLRADEGPPDIVCYTTLEAEILILYGRLGRYEAIRQFIIATNLARSDIPELTPFIDKDTSKFIPDYQNLKDAAHTVFKLPPELSWYPLYEGPTQESRVLGVVGKFGSSGLLTSTVHLSLLTNGYTELLVLRAPIMVDRK